MSFQFVQMYKLLIYIMKIQGLICLNLLSFFSELGNWCFILDRTVAIIAKKLYNLLAQVKYFFCNACYLFTCMSHQRKQFTNNNCCFDLDTHTDIRPGIMLTQAACFSFTKPLYKKKKNKNEQQTCKQLYNHNGLYI